MNICRFKALFLAFFLSLFTSYSVVAAPVDVNSANAEQISSALTGIGPAKAAAIVAFREQHGPFIRAEDLLAVKGVGAATLEKNRGDILIPNKEGKPAK